MVDVDLALEMCTCRGRADGGRTRGGVEEKQSDAAEAMYSVVDGKSYGQWCCFDYGNAEFDGIDDGNATMEAIYFGADTQFGQSGGGSGPWVAAEQPVRLAWRPVARPRRWR